jgi:outer membrane lipoprotein carrier protein
LHVRFFIVLSLFLMIVFIPTKHAFVDNQLEEIINGVTDRYGGSSGSTADYTRESISKAMNMLKVKDRHDVAKGRIFFKPPSFLRLDQASPQEELLLTNAKTLWWYIPEKNEAYKYPIERFGEELQLISNILKGMERIRDDFQISLRSGQEENLSLLMLSLKQPSQEIDHLEVFIDNGSFAIKQVSIYNNVSGVTKFFFNNWSQGKNFSDDFFSFVPPSGTKLIVQ